MLIKSILVIYFIVQEVFHFYLNSLRDKQRKMPLPKEVSDIYDKKRYQEFLAYKSEYRALSYKSEIASIGIDLFVLFSPFFKWMEAFHNVYVTLFVTVLTISGLTMILNYVVEYYATFHIEEKFGMNKKTIQEFNKDFILEVLLDLLMEFVLFGVMVFFCEHIVEWTNSFNITYIQSFFFVLVILLVFVLLFFVFMVLSLFVMMKQYTFTDLEYEELLSEIQRMMTGVKKKIKGIKVYNESKKSTTKNAFVLAIPFYRIVGIADNFLNENSKRELYGVLAHEIGHLKHKKDIFNYIKYTFLAILIVLLIWMIPNGMLIKEWATFVNGQFGLQESSYYLYFMLAGFVLEPFMFLFSIYNNYVVRREEYEADQNAVKEGYGEDLIRLFKNLSRDELVDVNPHPFIECLEYNHPGMYRRILGLKKAR
ncbi:MAG: M48 family metalloprotease [Bacillota bacterium]|nr:M48 family metalloprotease [Bacillota bacterium]